MGQHTEAAQALDPVTSSAFNSHAFPTWSPFPPGVLVLCETHQTFSPGLLVPAGFVSARDTQGLRGNDRQNKRSFLVTSGWQAWAHEAPLVLLPFRLHRNPRREVLFRSPLWESGAGAAKLQEG